MGATDEQWFARTYSNIQLIAVPLSLPLFRWQIACIHQWIDCLIEKPPPDFGQADMGPHGVSFVSDGCPTSRYWLWR